MDYGTVDCLQRLFLAPVASFNNPKITLKSAWFGTPLGRMIAIADEDILHLLVFFEDKKLPWEIARLRGRHGAMISMGRTRAICSIEREMEHYFKGTLKKFRTPIMIDGTPFQRTVWGHLQQIPIGYTSSYADIAKAMGRPSAFRAVAQANGANKFALIIPCHRVINTGGALGGYSAGLARKQWLLDHEQSAP